MKLFHLSENGNIEKFIPRESKAIWNHEKYVWAISEDKIQNYLFPRECPRICISDKEAKYLLTRMPTRDGYLENWIADLESNQFTSHIFVCDEWKEEIDTCLLFKYEFDYSNFKEIDEIAGYFVSTEIEIPFHKEPIKNCLKLLNSLNSNLKFITKKQMTLLRKDVLQNIKEFSIIKWENI